MAKGLIQTANWRSTTLIVSETALIIGAVAASVYLRVGAHAWQAVLADMLPKALVITSAISTTTRTSRRTARSC